MREQRLTRRCEEGREEEGAVAVLVAILGVVLVGLSAFAVDFGNAYATNRTLSTAADGAALAAAQSLGVNSSNGLTCGPAVPVADATAARAVADDYSSVRNAPGSNLLVGAAGFALACDTDGNGLVTVTNTKTVPFGFGNIFGRSSVSPLGVATAKYGQARTVTGLRPFGLCSLAPDVQSLLNQGAPGAGSSTVRVVVDKAISGGCGGDGSGNWGTLDLNGGSNGTPDTESWIQNGFHGVLDLVGANLPGNPGSPGGGKYASEMDSILGATITLPVYDSISFSGQNASFHIVKYVSATLCGWQFGNKSGFDATCHLTSPTPPNDFLELRFKDSYTVGDYQNCGNGGCLIDSGVIALQLVGTP